ncbi:hypothetical protein CROQUDRAFT_78748 [Cronartium quercuum f. sp. fusiforme G11]|uniref:Pentatricopeptide repeat-containing protein n=1 Tax=Cronartium quercuum f. sp. fusiforme G11 TaxID=708437 RepID=A0A9P6NH10_9BASI|nr:hypothetical protein CROQUDRAFT_78748 [Cronartium quercuum f. sp. fusiforme G11]
MRSRFQIRLQHIRYSTLTIPQPTPAALPPPNGCPSSTRQQLPIYLRYANNPSELNIRLQQLCLRPDGGLDAAIKLVKSSSIQVATVSVWTQLLQHVVQANRFSFVYKLFLEMKRRAIQPDAQFYVTFFASLAKCPPSKTITLARLQSLWTDTEPLLHSLAHLNRTALVNAYLHCLTSHGHAQAAFDLFETLPPRTIDSVTVSQMLKPLTSSHAPADRDRARSLWQRLGSTLDLDVRATMSFAALFLRSPDRADQKLAIEILESRLGLSLGPNYRFWAPPTKTGPLGKQIRFDAGSLSSLLRMLLGMRKYSVICRLWVQVVANRDLYLERDALDFVHCGLAMVAMGKCDGIDDVEALLVWMLESKKKKLLPRTDTLDKAMQAAWETNNLSASLRILHAFTHIPHDNILPATDLTMPLLSAAQTCPLKPSTRALCTLLQTAQSVGTARALERALLALSRVGCALLQTETEARAAHEVERREIRSSTGVSVASFDLSFERYWRRQYIWILTDVLDRVGRKKDDEGQWKSWRDRIDKHLEVSGDVEFRTRIEARSMGEKVSIEAGKDDRPQRRQKSRISKARSDESGKSLFL